MVSTQRKAELEAAFKKEAAWGAGVHFLDTINSVGELEELIPLLKKASLQDNEPVHDDFLSHYRDWLTRWPDPKLEDWFRKDFPLVSARLDTPQKIRVLLRGADFRGVTVSTMASVFEDIIKRHEVDGQKVVRYERYRGNSWCDALRIVYHSQVQAWTLTELMLPGKQCSGTHTGKTDYLFIDWRSKEEREAAGDR